MNSPIINTIFDIWFEPNKESEIIPGIIVENCKEYNKLKSLPLSGIPKDLILSDKNLKHQALYEIYPNDDSNPYKIILGYKMIGIALAGKDKYIGWDKSFLPKIEKIFSLIFKKEIVKKIQRIGLRYINFFENENIFKNSKIDIKINKSNIEQTKLTLINEKEVDDIWKIRAVIDNQINYKDKSGSIFDIASYYETAKVYSINELINKANKLHKISKNYFKEVISDELIKKLHI